MATQSFYKDFIVEDPEISAKILKDLQSNKSTLERMTEDEKSKVWFISDEADLKRLFNSGSGFKVRKS